MSKIEIMVGDFILIDDGPEHGDWLTVTGLSGDMVFFGPGGVADYNGGWITRKRITAHARCEQHKQRDRQDWDRML